MSDVKIPATYVRGGTSRAVVFKKADLPGDRGQWPGIFQAVLGSPDPESKQLDGLGGGITSLSKIAIVSPSARQGFDVDYLFAQVDPASGSMLLDANCGNISSAIGPYAMEEGWARRAPVGDTVVRIFNENSSKKIESIFNPETPEEAKISIAGVAGKRFPVRLRFEDPASSFGKGLFPTGAKQESLEVSPALTVTATLIDVTVPCVIVRALDVGLSGGESYAELNSNRAFVRLASEIRVAAALRMGICKTAQEARETVLNVPDVIVISPPADGHAGVVARFVSCDMPHRAAPVTSSMALASACNIEGTVAFEIEGHEPSGPTTIFHPSGTIEVDVELQGGELVQATSILRTARRIMQGEVLVPREAVGG